MLYLCPLKRTSKFFFYIHFPSFPSLYSVGLSTSGFLISSFISQCIFCFLSCSHSRSHLSFFFPLPLISQTVPMCSHFLFHESSSFLVSFPIGHIQSSHPVHVCLVFLPCHFLTILSSLTFFFISCLSPNFSSPSSVAQTLFICTNTSKQSFQNRRPQVHLTSELTAPVTPKNRSVHHG